MAFPVWLSYTFCILGTLFSLFYGFKACGVFGIKSEGKPRSWYIHQFWFNLAGSAIGWCTAWFVSLRVWHHMVNISPDDLGWSDAGLIAVAFVGITGHLPYATAGLLEGLKLLALKLTRTKE